jgi:hypothetical protein
MPLASTNKEAQEGALAFVAGAGRSDWVGGITVGGLWVNFGGPNLDKFFGMMVARGGVEPLPCLRVILALLLTTWDALIHWRFAILEHGHDSQEKHTGFT